MRLVKNKHKSRHFPASFVLVRSLSLRRFSCPRVNTAPSARRRPIALAETASRAGGRQFSDGYANIRIFNFDRLRPDRQTDGRTDGQQRRQQQARSGPVANAGDGRRVQLMPAIVRRLIDGRANAARVPNRSIAACPPAAALPVPLAPRSLHPHHSLPHLPLFPVSARAQLIILYRAIVRSTQRNNTACMELLLSEEKCAIERGIRPIRMTSIRCLYFCIK